MAITKTEFLVNSGNIGWTAEHVLNALELALGAGGAGHHSGAATSGVIRKIVKPTDGWEQVGGQIYPITNANTPTRVTIDGLYEYDYTFPDSGGRLGGVVTVSRYGTNYGSGTEGKVCMIYVRSGGSGWTDQAAITIPASEIGGVTATDITFGTNSATVPEIRTWSTKGGTSNWWWSDKDPSTVRSELGYAKHGVCRVTNDASKALGITYYSFGITNGGYIRMKSGPKWDDYRLHDYIGSTYFGLQGAYYGDPGMDSYGRSGFTNSYERQYDEYLTAWAAFVGNDDADPDGTSADDDLRYCRSNSPTDYPLKIVVYKAPSLQDPNYAVIQFQQIVSGNVETYFTFSLNKGTLWGQGIWDLDHVFQGSFTRYENYLPNTNTVIGIKTQDTIDTNQTYAGDPNSMATSKDRSTRVRECLYGYNRKDPGTYTTPKYWDTWDTYTVNIDGYVTSEGGYIYTDTTNRIKQYYRNSTYDSYTIDGVTYGPDSSLNFHKPIKGLPIASNMYPCPYYIPDDFVIIQVALSPGETVVRAGDTISISGSEVYTVILASGRLNDAFFGDDNNQVSRYVIFAARTV